MSHWTSRGAMNIEGLGIKVVQRLVETERVKNVSDYYTLSLEELSYLDTGRKNKENKQIVLGQKKAEKIMEELEASKKRGLARVLFGIGMRHVGKTTAEALSQEFLTLDGLRAATKEQLACVEGVGEKVALSIYDFLHTPENVEVLCELERLGVVMQDAAVISGAISLDVAGAAGANAQAGAGSFSGGASGGTAGEGGEGGKNSATGAGGISGANAELFPLPLKGVSFVLTGTLAQSGMSRDDAGDKLKALGARVSSSVSKKTRFVVCGNSPGSKYDKAVKLGIPVLDESQFLRILETRSLDGVLENTAG